MSETDLSAQVDAICRENERLTERVAALESELAKLRLAAKGKRGVYCRDGCGPLPGGRRGEAVRR